jgi:transposase-like protein
MLNFRLLLKGAQRQALLKRLKRARQIGDLWLSNRILSILNRPQKPKAGRVEEAHLYDELKRLRKENKRLKEERDILKKAAAYFAKASS